MGREHVSKSKPVIFAVNHQSAFVDPILAGSFTYRRPWYITRAGVFNTPLARWFFNSVHMLPIYRLRDKVNIIDANEETFKTSREILKTGGSMLIFPEGNHGMRKRLRTPLKKGFARIALQAEEEFGYNLGIDIIPVGIFYEHGTKFRSDCFIKFGEPINTKDYVELYRNDQNEGLNTITKDLAVVMAKNQINIQPLEKYDEIEAEWLAKRPKESDLAKRYYTDKQLTDDLSNGKSIKDQHQKKSIVPRIIAAVLGLPFFLYGLVNNLPVYLIGKWVLNNKIKDPHFFHSIMFVIALFGSAILTLIQSILVYALTGDGLVTLVYIVTTPFLGILAYDYYDILIRKKANPAATPLMQGFGH